MYDTRVQHGCKEAHPYCILYSILYSTVYGIIIQSLYRIIKPQAIPITNLPAHPCANRNSPAKSSTPTSPPANLSKPTNIPA